MSWRAGSEPGDGRNVVFHEFAHHLDGLDGAMDGVPPLEGRAAQRRWQEVTEAEYRAALPGCRLRPGHAAGPVRRRQPGRVLRRGHRMLLQRPGSICTGVIPSCLTCCGSSTGKTRSSWFRCVARPAAPPLAENDDGDTRPAVLALRASKCWSGRPQCRRTLHRRRGPRPERAATTGRSNASPRPSPWTASDAEAFRQRAESLLGTGPDSRGPGRLRPGHQPRSGRSPRLAGAAEVRTRLADHAGAAADQAAALRLEQGR